MFTWSFKPKREVGLTKMYSILKEVIFTSCGPRLDVPGLVPTFVPSLPHLPHPSGLARAQVTASVFRLHYALIMELEVRDLDLKHKQLGLFVLAEPAPWSPFCFGQ